MKVEVRPEIDMFLRMQYSKIFNNPAVTQSQGVRDDPKNGEGREVGGKGSQSLQRFFREVLEASSSNKPRGK